MRPDSRDLTIDTVLSDPMIRAVMAADHVTARELERLLRSAAGRLDVGRTSAPSRPFQLAPPRCGIALGLCPA